MLDPRTVRSAAALTALAASAGLAAAQPADRPTAFTQAIGAAMTLAPSYVFHEAALESDRGQWIVKVELVSLNAAQQIEYEISASTFAVLKTETESVFPAQQAALQAILAQVGSATVTPAQAIAAAAALTPSGSQMQEIELEREGGSLVYKFEFRAADGSKPRVLINAASGAASGGGGGGNNPPPSGPLPTAVQAALAAYPGARVLEVEFEPGDDRWEVKLLTAQGVLRKLRVSTAGALLADDVLTQSREDRGRDRLRSVFAPRAQITLEQATQTALAANPGASAVKAEWEFERGLLVAKVVVQDAVGQRTVLVSAASGQIVPPQGAVDPAPAPTPTIDAAAAGAAALAVNPGAVAVEIEAEAEGGRIFYKVRTLTTTQPLRLRESVVDGKTGKVWSTTLMPMATDYLARARRIVQLLPARTKSVADAQAIALSTLADGRIDSIDLEPEDAGLVYKVGVLVGTKVFRLDVDAATGAVTPR